jgi:hypothetical protein
MQIQSFLDWLGEGRKLTQTGRIGLADARYLVEFLDTGDVIDPAIGGGSPGFAEFKAVLAWPPGTERDKLLAWAGGDYDPGRFDLSAANTAVAAV